MLDGRNVGLGDEPVGEGLQFVSGLRERGAGDTNSGRGERHNFSQAPLTTGGKVRIPAGL